MCDSDCPSPIQVLPPTFPMITKPPLVFAVRGLADTSAFVRTDPRTYGSFRVPASFLKIGRRWSLSTDVETVVCRFLLVCRRNGYDFERQTTR